MSGFKSLGKGMASIGEGVSTFSIWPNTTPEQYQRNAQDYIKRSKAYAKKAGVKENNYLFKNPYLERLEKDSMEGCQKDKEAFQKDYEANFK